MQVESVTGQAQDHGFAELYEPTCGAGAFCIAMLQAMQKYRLNPQTQLHVSAEDVPPQVHAHDLGPPGTAAHSGCGAPSGHAVPGEVRHLADPAHILGGWGQKLHSASKPAGLPASFTKIVN